MAEIPYTGGSSELDWEFQGLVYFNSQDAELRFKREGENLRLLALGIKELEHRHSDQPSLSALEVFEDHPMLLDYGPRASLFGRAPLPDPYRFFLEFHKLVRDEFAIDREPIRYLNYKGRMSEWLSIVYSRSFTAMTGPLVLAEAATKLLDAQVAEYTLIPEPSDIQTVRYLRHGACDIFAREFKRIQESSL